MGRAHNRRIGVTAHVSREESHAGRQILSVLCKYVTSPKNEINHDIAIKWSQNTKEPHKGHELQFISAINSKFKTSIALND